MARRFRRWCFTWNNYSDADEQRLRGGLPDGVRYLVFGREEAPRTKTKHLQGYVAFDQPETMLGAKTILGGQDCHLERARGSEQQNYVYCTKSGDFFEVGERSRQGEGGRNLKEEWAKARDSARAGKFDDIPADMFCRYVRNFKEIRYDAEQHQKIPDLPDACGDWWWGVSGAGKSYKARHDFPGCYIKGHHKWWNGYDENRKEHETVLIDDLGKECAQALCEHIKQWTDAYSFSCETKGGSKFIRPKRIIITSNYSLEDCFPDATTISTLRRRFRVLHFGQVHPKCPKRSCAREAPSREEDEQVRGLDEAAEIDEQRERRILVRGDERGARSRSPPQPPVIFKDSEEKGQAEEAVAKESHSEAVVSGDNVDDAVVFHSSPWTF